MEVKLQADAVSSLEAALKKRIDFQQMIIDRNPKLKGSSEELIVFLKSIDAARALNSLVRVTNLAVNDDTGGSRVCATFIVNIHNGGIVKFNIIDLNILDRSYYQDCLNILNLNRILHKEIYGYLENGQDVMDEIIDEWEFLERT